MPRKKRKTAAPKCSAEPAERQPQVSLDQGEQSGDLQGLSGVAGADMESVRELVEEGQFFEAEVVSGVEEAPPADAGPVKARRRREDDV